MKTRRRSLLVHFYQVGFTVLFLLLTGCGFSLPSVFQQQVPIPPGNYTLQWLQESPGGDLIKLPGNSDAQVTTEFTSVGDPIPEGAIMALYLHKDPVASTLGPSGTSFDSLFHHWSWGNTRRTFPDGVALQITTAPFHNGKVHFAFSLSGNGVNPSRDCAARGHEFRCREDFGVAFLGGKDEWLNAEVGKGGRPGSGRGGLGYANAWWDIQITADSIIAPWWSDSNLLAFIFICIIWAVIAKFAWFIAAVRGFLFIIGAILVLTIIGWVQYQFFSDPTRVASRDFDQAKQQAVLRMRIEWGNNDQFQPQGCATTAPATDFPDRPELTRMSQSLRVAIVPCPGSTWSFNQPGAILTWRDAYGTQVIPIIGAQWKLYQEQYAQLGRPTSLPYLLQRSPDVVGQDFGISQRVIYVQKGAGQGTAWVQPRKRLFWTIPNMFCVVGLTDGGQGCWDISNSNNADRVYTPYAPQQVTPDADWLAGRTVPLGGWWAPLNVWKSLFLSVGLCVAFLALSMWSEVMNAIGKGLGCLGIVILLIVVTVGINVMIVGLLLGFSDPRSTLPKVEGSHWTIVNILIEYVSPEQSIKHLETINKVTLVHPDSILSYLTHLGESWIDAWVTMRNQTKAHGYWLLVAGLGNTILGEILAFLVLPVWLGMAVAGEMGAWLGLIVEVGMIIAGLFGRSSSSS